MTFDYRTIPLRRKTIDTPHRISGFSERRQAVSRKLKRNRRKQNIDRRSSVRDGVIVNLSCKNDRRKGTDRRQSFMSGIRL